MTRPAPATHSRAKATLTWLSWAATAATLYRGVRGAVQARGSLAWVARLQREPAANPPATAPRFVLLLPVLREQRLLAATTAHLVRLARSSPGASVALVTTERERAERAAATRRLPELARLLARRPPASTVLGRFLGVLPRDRLERLTMQAAGLAGEAACLAAAEAALAELPTTDQLAARLVADAQARGAPIRHYHYPHGDGTMARQVNFAARAELDRLAHQEGADPADCWLVVYNADSRPDPATLAEATLAITRLAGAPGGPPRVLQQPALTRKSDGEWAGGSTRWSVSGAGSCQ